MECANCNHNWCWICGLKVKEGSLWDYIHMPCEIVLSLKEEVKGIKKVLCVFLAIILFVIAPVLIYIVALGYYIYGLIYGSMILKDKLKLETDDRAVHAILTTITIILFIVFSTVLAALCIVFIGLAIVIAYILFIVMFVLMTFQWCVSSKRSKKSYITEKESLNESLLEEDEDLEN